MSAQDNLKVVRDFWDAVEHHGPTSQQTIMELMDDDIEVDNIPAGLKVQGKQEFTHFIEGLWANAPHGESEFAEEVRHDETNAFASEDWVCVEYTVHGTVKKELPTGQPSIAGIDVVNLFRIQNGKIARIREYYDSASLMQVINPVVAAGSIRLWRAAATPSV